ncbi:NAD-dependent protein lipoamidase sirtuin-4, mitochondrial-like isoform X3 [Biomphalaria glabrata]|uniref:NAD-dependent protein deacylase n=1 Tax=Biomphalaria glabrata TaxID=6526 RepID=A0A9W2YH75_BIOGL|nr:NAD-dependent protein lipoamidase sirtuin-4, mitochondrial-like isoform X1 [Biomphalaria glabrata]XP_013090444.2 NAD-dependent protein lipoamidase sirtuin-4, mitochondrial-like isoform X2 [Biomphalaria glabrata]XP_055862021.1 NAD-dependent protein lipoamidase sirtuin-4, mitochondrial-like isoform X3 [Biomphalaria glabrata]
MKNSLINDLIKNKLVFKTCLKSITSKNGYHHSASAWTAGSLEPSSKYVPTYKEVDESQFLQLQDFILEHPKLFILTGAGVSTESGIPDYRSEGVGRYATSTSRPIQYADFLKNAASRQRYWARNYIGWPQFSSFQPNQSHYILSNWERKGLIHWLVTQNVDALHYKAGSQKVTELHGSAHRVICLSCKYQLSRHAMQELIANINLDWSADVMGVAPDGDVDLTSNQVQNFKVPECPKCKGILKPDLTFFGDNVPKETVHFVLEKLFESDAMLVIGSSLEVYSGYRFAYRAHEHGMKIGVINIGPTRGDKFVDIKVSAKCSDVLQRLDQKSQ